MIRPKVSIGHYLRAFAVWNREVAKSNSLLVIKVIVRKGLAMQFHVLPGMTLWMDYQLVSMSHM